MSSFLGFYFPFIKWVVRIGDLWFCIICSQSKWLPTQVISFNTLKPRQNGRHFPDDAFKCISLNENVWISLKISLKFVPKGPINNIPALVQIMAWRRPGDKPLSEAMLVSLLTHKCITRPQWVKRICFFAFSWTIKLYQTTRCDVVFVAKN